ncbi:DUF4339 domain-containing protein [Bombella sp. TMW 2.2559]|uniref:DUF4339 domain-containing protein n=1 Tax=Bombella dulcis TaxID=2967339 RepID=A0ABT3WIN7_9PROT|nr:DUF4339 domain-containing protein [Bombella dulcis]MCX5616706.1 DUF4339 domain-containing protein [Bombella dulcis]
MQWYYERDGQPIGPVSQAEVIRLIVRRRICPQTLVWHPGLGAEWCPADRAGLVPPSAGVKILFTRGDRCEGISDTLKEPGSVSSVWAWLMLLPGLVDLLLLMAGQRTHWAVTPGRPVTGLCIYAILFLTLIKDRQTLDRAGVKPPSFWWWLFLPGYFWCRRKVLRRGGGLFAACLILGFLEAAVLLSNPPPGFEPLLMSQKQTERPAATAPQKTPETAHEGQQGAGKEDQPSDAPSSSDEQIQL